MDDELPSEVRNTLNIFFHSGKRIRISKDNFAKEFDSVKDCAEWFVENNICKTKSSESARTGLKKARSEKGNGIYYGYKIENI